jgi:large repetitive protein
VANGGSGSAKGSWYDRVYFSTNETWESTDTLVATDYISISLASGSNYSPSMNFTLPSVPEGRYWLILRVDTGGAINETNESNNQLVIPIDVVVPDLAIADFRLLSGSLATGRVQVAWTIANQGSGTAKSSWYDRVYFSTNETWESTDDSLGVYYETHTLAPSGHYSRTNTFTLPAVPGGRAYLILRTDTGDAVFESLEANNTAVLNLAPTEPLPSLGIRWVPPLAEIYWPTSAVGFTLRATPRLGSSAEWSVPTNSLAIVGTNYSVTVDPALGDRFFRLLRE